MGSASVLTGLEVTRTVFTNTYWDNTAAGYRTDRQRHSLCRWHRPGHHRPVAKVPIEYGTSPSIYTNWNIDVDADWQTGN